MAVKDNIYLPRVFAQEDETARRIAMRLVEPSEPERIERVLERVKREMGVVLSSKQEAAATIFPLSQALPVPAKRRF